jgi:hypothetical protein
LAPTPSPTPSSQSIPIFFYSWRVGGPGRAGVADFGELSGVDMQAGLHFRLGGEWKPNCQEYLFHVRLVGVVPVGFSSSLA